MRTFVYNQLSQTYGLEAESIIKSLNEKLTTMEENTSDCFQILLQTIVYPFLFTVDILKSAVKSEREATQFVRTAWSLSRMELSGRHSGIIRKLIRHYSDDSLVLSGFNSNVMKFTFGCLLNFILC